MIGIFHLFIKLSIAVTLFNKWSDAQQISQFILTRKLSTGLIEGRRSITSYHNRTGLVFEGIPYGKNTSEKYRFTKPSPVDPWNGTLETKSFGLSCIYNSSLKHTPDNAVLGENCLNINVYTSTYCLLNGNCPVLFFIHGGGNLVYGPSMFEEETIIDNFANNQTNIILVTPHFRLGALGFLNLNHQLNLSMTQNAALFDLTLALEWVGREIKEFGGNPDKVTVGGHSSGAVLANLLSISPKTRGLMSQVLQQSGTRPLTTTQNTNEHASRIISNIVGCSSIFTDWDNIKEVEKVIKCLRAAPIQNIVDSVRAAENQNVSLHGGGTQDYGFNSFFEKDLELLADERMNIPLMIGTTEQESSESRSCVRRYSNGSTLVDLDHLKFYCEYSLSDAIFNNQSLAVDICMEEYKNDPERAMHVLDDIQLFYLTVVDANTTTLNGGSAYLYNFEYKYVDDPSGLMSKKIDQRYRPLHADDCVLFLGNHGRMYNEQEYEIRKVYIEPFVNFIKKGNPSSMNYSFDAFNPKLNNYFAFDFDKDLKMPGMRSDFHKAAIDYVTKKLLPNVGQFSLNKDEWLHEYYRLQDKLYYNTNNTFHDNIIEAGRNSLIKCCSRVSLLKTSPIVTHCSARRTGSFICIWYIAEKYRTSIANVDVMKSIEEVRKQRSLSVQTRIQFIFLKIAIIQYWFDEKIVAETLKSTQFIPNISRKMEIMTNKLLEKKKKHVE
uniref:Carboxylic ester hydrolase n=1 Tax=Rhabditophanes sp. KR3021 TaxID=114890 RepID=A0AC35THN7_9BILA